MSELGISDYKHLSVLHVFGNVTNVLLAPLVNDTGYI